MLRKPGDAGMVAAMQATIEAGLRTHLGRLRARWHAGERRLGWKVAFNGEAIQASLGLSYSLAAGMTDRTLIAGGVGSAPAQHSLSGATRVALEAEVALGLAAPVSAGAGPAAAEGAVASIAPAIEVVDFDRPPAELEAVLADGVFHRGLLLGEPMAVPDGAALRGMRALVSSDGETVAEVDAEQASGRAGDVLVHVASLLEPLGESLQAGDIVIMGSMNPLVFPEPGSHFTLQLGSAPPLSLHFTA